MTLLIDTNVLLDVFLQRKPFENFSKQILEVCMLNKHEGIIAAHSFTDLFYLLKKYFNSTDLRSLLLQVTKSFKIATINKEKIVTSLLRNDFPDFEDCLQDECANEFSADYIITRNTKDFATAKTKVLTPEQFLML